jgi:hypothetical protein
VVVRVRRYDAVADDWEPSGRREMTEQGVVAGNCYNYETFVGDDDFLAFRTALPVGSKAPDFPVVVAATGEPAHLSDFWRDADLLIEFGSLT